MYLFYLFGFVCFATGAIADESPITSKTEYDQAIAYENGVGVSQDSCKAFDLFLQCAKRGDPRAKYKVGVAYFNGVGVAKDQVEGLAWMYNAVSSGISGAVCASMEAILGAKMSIKAKDRSKELIPQSPLLATSSNGGNMGGISEVVASVKARFGSDSGSMTADDFEKMALEVRNQALRVTSHPATQTASTVTGFGKYPWHRNVIPVLFWVGMKGDNKNSYLRRSVWDSDWFTHFGGYDNPNSSFRDPRTYAPRGFIPSLNPFYCALPYNDIENGETKQEARAVIPWFLDCYDLSGRSVLKGRWIAIHHAGRTCFAQWEDCFSRPADDWEYVFGQNQPRKTKNGQLGIGLVISPAARDYLQLEKNDLCDWKFIDAASVPDGPWKYYGDNNTFVLLRKGVNLYQYDRNNAKRSPTTTYTAQPRMSPVFGGQ